MAKKLSLEDLKRKAAPAKESAVKKEAPAVKKEEEAVDPIKELQAFRKKTQKLLKVDLARFHLSVRDVGPTEFVIYQGTQSNVWARFNLNQKLFYRTVLERQFEKAGLLDPSNDVVFRR